MQKCLEKGRFWVLTAKYREKYPEIWNFVGIFEVNLDAIPKLRRRANEFRAIALQERPGIPKVDQKNKKK